MAKVVPICKWEARPVFTEDELRGDVLDLSGPGFMGVLAVEVPFDQYQLALDNWFKYGISTRHELEVHFEPRWIAPQNPVFTVKCRSWCHNVASDIQDFYDAFDHLKVYWTAPMSDHDWGAVYFDRTGKVLDVKFEDYDGA